MKQFALGVLLLFGMCSNSWAFPELVRHHYANCISCHVSPNGGGVLTPYGRELSAEVLSTWIREGEGAFAYGLVKTPESGNLSLGGDLRMLQTYENSATSIDGRFIYMQTDLEGAVTLGQWQGDATFGHGDVEGYFSRRHFLGYRPTDQTSLRVGKFMSDFGLKTPEHVISIKRDLNFDEGSETYNAEAAWLGDKYNVFATAIFGRPDLKTSAAQHGVALTASTFIADQYKPGLSFYAGSNSKVERRIFGPWAILGFTPQFFLLSEFDFQWQKNLISTAAPIAGWVDYQRLDYEVYRGVHFYLTQEYSRLDMKEPLGTQTFGIGCQFFPRPHFEINLAWQLISALDKNKSFNDFGWLLLHFYP